MATLYGFLSLKHNGWSFHLHALLQYVPAGLLLHFAGRCRSHFGGVVFYICLPKPEVPTHPALCDIMALAFTCCNTAPWDILYSSFIYEKTLANYSSCIHSVVLFSNRLRRLYRSEKHRKVLWYGLWIPLIFKLTNFQVWAYPAWFLLFRSWVIAFGRSAIIPVLQESNTISSHFTSF